MLKNNSGYDLKQLFIGTEGTLGLVTRADLRLVSRSAESRHGVRGLPRLRGAHPAARRSWMRGWAGS